MSTRRRVVLGFAGISAAVVIGGSVAWACTPMVEAGPSQYSEGAAPAAPVLPPTAVAEPEPVATAAAQPVASQPAAKATAPAPAPVASPRRAEPAPAPVAATPAPAAAPAVATPAPAAPAPPAAALTADAWSGFETARTAANTPASTDSSSDSGSGQFGLGLALLGAGIATLAVGGVVATRRRAVKVPTE
jgi:hypothetical protein